MRCLGTLAVLVIGVAGGAYATVVDPPLPGQVAHAVTSDVEWLAGSLSRIGDATRHPSQPVPEPTGTKPVPLITPDPTPETTTYPGPVATPSPTSTPAVLGWTLPWSNSDRDWVLSTLTLDMQLDTQAETTYPAWQAYYAGWAQRWAKAIALVQGLEYPQAVGPSAATLDPIVGWFNTAISLHQQDEQTYPANKAWDDDWVSRYQHLDALWAKL